MATLMTYPQLAAHLKNWGGISLSKRSLLRFRSEGLPTIVLGYRKLRFDVEAVQNWILAHSESTGNFLKASDRALKGARSFKKPHK